MIDTETEAFDGGEDVGGGFGPFEGLRVFVVLFDEGADVGFELAGRGVHAALQLLAHQFGEPAFDLIDPGSGGRREVDVPVRSPRQPSLDRRGLVGGVVVHDDVEVQPLGDAPVDLLQEVEELPGPVASVALADDAARGDIEGCEQRGGAVTLVVVCAPLGHARQHRQDRLAAVQRLDLALFVDTEHQRAVRRREIEAYDVAHLVHEQRVAGELEGLRAVRLHAEGRPYPPDRRVRQSALPGHRADRPVGGIGRRRLQRPLDNLGHLFVRERPRPSRPRLIRQPLDALLQEAAAPLADRVLVHAEFGCHRLVRQTVCYSARKFDPPGSRNLKRLALR